MKNPKLLLLLAITVITIGFIALDHQHGITPAPNSKTLPKASTVPDVQFKAISEDQTVTFDTFKGNYILLNFWASWCAPCLAEFPHLLNLANEFSNEIVLITLSIDETPEQAQTFIDKFDKNTKAENIFHAWDKEKNITQNIFQTFRYPESILINSKGEMVRKYAGVLTEDNLEEIKSMLKD